MLRWIISAVIVLLFVSVLYLLSYVGSASKLYGNVYSITEKGIPVYSLRSSSDVYSFWKSHGFRGRVVLHLGRYLHFVQVDETEIYLGKGKFPVKTSIMIKEYEQKLDNRNFLWIVMQGNIARQIINVLPPDAFREKLSGIGDDLTGISLTGHEIITHYLGSRRVITDRIPALREPVLINIDASYFEYSDAESLLSELRHSGITTDMITFCFAEDNPEVTEKERQRLDEFAVILLGKKV